MYTLSQARLVSTHSLPTPWCASAAGVQFWRLRWGWPSEHVNLSITSIPLTFSTGMLSGDSRPIPRLRSSPTASRLSTESLISLKTQCDVSPPVGRSTRPATFNSLGEGGGESRRSHRARSARGDLCQPFAAQLGGCYPTVWHSRGTIVARTVQNTPLSLPHRGAGRGHLL